MGAHVEYEVAWLVTIKIKVFIEGCFFFKAHNFKEPIACWQSVKVYHVDYYLKENLSIIGEGNLDQRKMKN